MAIQVGMHTVLSLGQKKNLGKHWPNSTWLTGCLAGLGMSNKIGQDLPADSSQIRKQLPLSRPNFTIQKPHRSKKTRADCFPICCLSAGKSHPDLIWPVKLSSQSSRKLKSNEPTIYARMEMSTHLKTERVQHPLEISDFFFFRIITKST